MMFKTSKVIGILEDENSWNWDGNRTFVLEYVKSHEITNKKLLKLLRDKVTDILVDHEAWKIPQNRALVLLLDEHPMIVDPRLARLLKDFSAAPAWQQFLARVARAIRSKMTRRRFIILLGAGAAVLAFPTVLSILEPEKPIAPEKAIQPKQAPQKVIPQRRKGPPVERREKKIPASKKDDGPQGLGRPQTFPQKKPQVPQKIIPEEYRPKVYGTIAYADPIDLRKGQISERFGIRNNPFNSRKKEFHHAIDIRAPNGTPVYAMFDGIIEASGKRGAAGLRINIYSRRLGLKTYYYHLSRTYKRTGARVKAGDRIGSVGSTGRSTGNHLHFEVAVVDWARAAVALGVDNRFFYDRNRTMRDGRLIYRKNPRTGKINLNPDFVRARLKGSTYLQASG